MARDVFRLPRLLLVVLLGMHGSTSGVASGDKVGRSLGFVGEGEASAGLGDWTGREEEGYKEPEMFNRELQKILRSNDELDDFYVDPVVRSPSYRVDRLVRKLERALETSKLGSNCIEVGGGYSPKYSLCNGCVVQNALNCISDMRHNASKNVPGGCDLTSLMVEPQPKCCAKFDESNPGKNQFLNKGTTIVPETAAYNDALLCLQRSNCMCVDGICIDESSDGYNAEECPNPPCCPKKCPSNDMTLDIYKDLEAECLSHTVHEDCRTRCDVWKHDGELPNPNDCKAIEDGGCWEYRDPPTPPKFRTDLDSCKEGSTPYIRWKTEIQEVDERLEVSSAYDWWVCWHQAHCYNPETQGIYYPPIRDGKKIYGEECTAEEKKEVEDAGAGALFDCVPGGIPLYCNSDLDDDTGIPVGIEVAPKSGIVKYEYINCRLDPNICKPTQSGVVGGWFTGWLIQTLACLFCLASTVVFFNG